MNIKVPEHQVAIGINTKAYPVRKVPYILAFMHTEEPMEPVQVCLFSHFTLEYIRQASKMEIGHRVKEMIEKIDAEIKRVEQTYANH